MSQSQKSLKTLEEETNQLAIATKNLSVRTEQVITNINKNIDLKLNQLAKEKSDLKEKLSVQEKTINQSSTEVKNLKDQKTKLLEEIRQKDLKIDELETKIKELNKKLAQ